jgi:hypothetical protein
MVKKGRKMEVSPTAVKVTIDLGGATVQTSDASFKKKLEIKGPGMRVRIANGKIILPGHRALHVTDGASLELKDVHITKLYCESRKEGIVVASKPGTTAALDDCTIVYHDRRTWRGSATGWEVARHYSWVTVTEGASAALRKCWIQQGYAGVRVKGAGSRATAESCMVTKAHYAGFLAQDEGWLRRSAVSQLMASCMGS